MVSAVVLVVLACSEFLAINFLLLKQISAKSFSTQLIHCILCDPHIIFSLCSAPDVFLLNQLYESSK